MIFAVGNRKPVFGSFLLTLIRKTMKDQENMKDEAFVPDDGMHNIEESWPGLFGQRLKNKNWSDPLWVQPDDDEDLAY